MLLRAHNYLLSQLLHLWTLKPLVSIHSAQQLYPGAAPVSSSLGGLSVHTSPYWYSLAPCSELILLTSLVQAPVPQESPGQDSIRKLLKTWTRRPEPRTQLNALPGCGWVPGLLGTLV